MSDTPLTDRQENEHSDYVHYVSANFARRLERRCARLERALRWYAQEGIYVGDTTDIDVGAERIPFTEEILSDCGANARAALEEGK